MAAPPRLKLLSAEAFADLDPEVRKGVEKLIESLNPFLTATTNGLAKGLTFSENMAAVVKTVEFTMPDPWVYLEASDFDNSWAKYSDTYKPAYRIHDDGMVELRGAIKDGTLQTTAFTLPAGYRPVAQRLCTTFSNGGIGRVDIDTAGVVQIGYGPIGSNTHYALDDIQFTSLNPELVSKGAPFPLLVSCPELPGKPRIVLVGRCEDITDRGVSAGPCPTISWEPTVVGNKTGVKITDAKGLVPNRKYRLTLVVTV